MAIVVKRVYEPAVRTDGTRVLVDRLWPRGLSKDRAAVDHWLRDLAPSNALRKWFHRGSGGWPDFRKRYLKELTQDEAAAALVELYGLVNENAKITLLFSSKNEEHNNAVVLKELLNGMRKPPTGTGPATARAGRKRQAKRTSRK